MAKALLGHVGGGSSRASEQTRQLRRRVFELEAQVLRLKAENDALAAAAEREALGLDGADLDHEPALL